MRFIVALLLIFLCVCNAIYYKVESETCSELSTADGLFDNLIIPCASFNAVPVDLKCLSTYEIPKYLSTVPDWTYLSNTTTGNAIFRSFEFADFRTAFLFMTESAQLADKNEHHPNWSNLWSTVDVTLNTDDQLCLSTWDIELAQGMDYIYTYITQ